MNDDDIIQRLRSALDEVADTSAGEPVPSAPSVREGFGRGRWIAIAAAVALIGAATVVLVQHRGSDEPAAGATTSPATVPTTTSPASTAAVTPTTTDTPRSTVPSNDVAWYSFDLPGFTAQAPQFDYCCKPWPAPGPDISMAWGDVRGIDHGLLLMRTKRNVANGPATFTFETYGLTKAQAVGLEKQITPGSGLPYVLPDPSMQLLGNGLLGDGNLISQTWTSGGSKVLVTVGDYQTQLYALTRTTGWTTTPVAGLLAYRADDDMGSNFIWQTPRGQWATMHIDIELSKHIDEILAALKPAPAPADPAVSTTTTVGTGTSASSVAGTLTMARTGLIANVSTEQTTGSGWFLAPKSVDPSSATSKTPAALTWSQQSAPTGEAVPSFRVGDQLRWTARDGSVTVFTVTAVVHLPPYARGGPMGALVLRVQEIDATPTQVYARRG
jgi:hypothetical protein